MSEAVWDKAFTQGSRALQDRLKKVHAKNPKFQAWLQKSGHGAGASVKQASKEVKATERVKKLQAKSLAAYGATKGVKVGGEHGSDEVRDTIAPLTRDQHSKVQAAERASKAAAKAAAPKAKKPLSKAQRMAAIAAAVRKSKTKHDVPTVDPDDMDHDDLRDLHQSLHVSRSYNEEVELDEMDKSQPSSSRGAEGLALGKKADPVKTDKVKSDALKLLQKQYKKVKEEVEVDESVATAQKVMDRANIVAKTNPDPKKRFAASGLAQKAMLRTINPTGVNTGITRGGGNKTYRMVTGKVPPYQLTKKTGVSEEVEQIDESDKVAKNIAKSMIAGKGELKVSTMNADESGAEGHQGKVHFVHHKDDEGEGDYIAVSHHKGKYVVSHTLSSSAGEEKPTKHFDNPDHAIAYGRKIIGEEIEVNEGKMKDIVTNRQETERLKAQDVLGGPVKTRTGAEPKGKLPLGFRAARNLARKAMNKGAPVTEGYEYTNIGHPPEHSVDVDPMPASDPLKLSTKRKKPVQYKPGMKDGVRIREESTEETKMNKGKLLAKAIMAKQSKHPLAQNMGEEVKDVADVGEYDYEGDMAKSQLRSILANAKRLHDMLEDQTNLPEWVQSKITLAEDYILTAANYMEGEMNEETIRSEEAIFEAMKKMADEMDDEEDDDMEDDEEEDDKKKANEEVDQTDEAVRVVDRFYPGVPHDDQKRKDIAATVKKIRKDPDARGGMTGFNRYQDFFGGRNARLGAERTPVGEEVEQIDERNMENKTKKNVMATKLGVSTYVYGKGVGVNKYDHEPSFKADPAGFKKVGRSVMQSPKTTSSQVTALKKANEEVEEVDEKVEIFHKQGLGADMERHKKDTSNPAAVFARKKAADAARQSRAAGDLKSKNMGQTASTGNGGAVKAVSTMSQGFKKGSRITEAEGKVAVTPKEKELAAHHGDPKKITYGDVIKARIKSAAAKAMNKGK